MAKMRCKCGALIRDDDPRQSLVLVPHAEFDEDVDAGTLLGRGSITLRCAVCGRLWVFWDDSNQGTEYVEIHED